MIESVMQKICYRDPPNKRTAEGYRSYLRTLFNYSCAYCTITEAESLGATFNIDHFRPESQFSYLASECTNLRYSCPRCNSYKRDLWISREEGCIRNCKECSLQLCKMDIPRFIDAALEDPANLLHIDDNDKIFAYNDSVVAKYTIDNLRLNRAQLVRMRYVRRYMESWKKQLLIDLDLSKKRAKEIEQKKAAFSELKEKCDLSSQQSRILAGTIETIIQVLENQEERVLLQILSSIQRLEKLEKMSFGSES